MSRVTYLFMIVHFTAAAESAGVYFRPVNGIAEIDESREGHGVQYRAPQAPSEQHRFRRVANVAEDILEHLAFSLLRVKVRTASAVDEGVVLWPQPRHVALRHHVVVVVALSWSWHRWWRIIDQKAVGIV